MPPRPRVGAAPNAARLAPCRSRRARSAAFLSTDAADGGAAAPVASRPLSETLRDAYEGGDTDAILALAPGLLARRSARELVLAAADAADGRSGATASVVNALLGGCVRLSDGGDDDLGPRTARDLLGALDGLSEDVGTTPDLVTFCLAFAALDAGGAPFAPHADRVLDRARRAAKRRGGSETRKAINRSARGGGGEGGVRAADAADELAARHGADFRILHEDDQLVVVSKPSGMVCFHKRRTTAGKVGRKNKKKRGGGSADADVPPDVSLTDALAAVNVPLSNLNPDGRGVVHRIDRGTSGCVALAKTDRAHALLVAQFFVRGARKRYDALVPAHRPVDGDGEDPLEDSGEIDLPVGGKAAMSVYEVKRRIGDVAVLLGLETRTGRKHQVRVHCAEGLGRPLFLDPVYGAHGNDEKAKGRRRHPRRKGGGGSGDDSKMRPELPEAIARAAMNAGGRQRFFLHASALSVPGLGVDAEAPLPAWWEEALKGLEEASR